MMKEKRSASGILHWLRASESTADCSTRPTLRTHKSCDAVVEMSTRRPINMVQQ